MSLLDVDRNPAFSWLPGWVAPLAVSRMQCPRCGSGRDVDCMTAGGDVARTTHWARVEPFAMTYSNAQREFEEKP